VKYISKERWGAGVETKKMYGERLGDGVEYHLMRNTSQRRGGGLGSSTIFKKFHETYAPS